MPCQCQSLHDLRKRLPAHYSFPAIGISPGSHDFRNTNFGYKRYLLWTLELAMSFVNNRSDSLVVPGSNSTKTFCVQGSLGLHCSSLDGLEIGSPKAVGEVVSFCSSPVPPPIINSRNGTSRTFPSLTILRDSTTNETLAFPHSRRFSFPIHSTAAVVMMDLTKSCRRRGIRWT